MQGFVYMYVVGNMQIKFSLMPWIILKLSISHICGQIKMESYCCLDTSKYTRNPPHKLRSSIDSTA